MVFVNVFLGIFVFTFSMVSIIAFTNGAALLGCITIGVTIFFALLRMPMENNPEIEGSCVECSGPP